MTYLFIAFVALACFAMHRSPWRHLRVFGRWLAVFFVPAALLLAAV